MSQFGKIQPSAVPASGRSSLLTYEPYYGLREKPFSLSSDPRFLYKSPSHAPTFDDLRAGIRRREGLIVLTGDIGTGKTTLCKAVLEDLDRKTFSTFVPDPFLSREDLLKMLLVEFGVMSVDDVKEGRLKGASRPDLSYPLYEFLKSLVPLQAFAVLIIDEAQNLPVPLLEEIRILSDLEDPEKLLQVVLVGQLELQAKLKLPEMRQVDQRVSVRCELRPLSRDVVAGYIEHRLAVAGGGRDRVEFSEDAVDDIYRVSQGVPRIVNLICDRALHHGYLERSARIHQPHVVRATIDLGLRRPVEAPAPVPVRASSMGLDDLLSLKPEPFAHSEAEEESIVDAAPIATFAPVSDVSRTFLIDTPEPVNVESTNGRRRHRKLRRAAAMVAIVLGSAAVLVALSYRQDQMAELAQGVTLPPLPAAPTIVTDRSIDFLPMHIAASIAMAEPPGVYTIDVALFNSEDRAKHLVDDLTAAGHQAFVSVRQFARGPVYAVRIGPYILQTDAAAELARLHERPRYADARISAVLPSTAQ